MNNKWDNFKLDNGKTVSYMRQDNLKWWKSKGYKSEKPLQRLPYYNKFLNNIKSNFVDFDIKNYEGMILGEICGGPFGGIIEHFYPNDTKYQIDIFADDFEKLNWLQSDVSKTTWVASPCEEIELEDNKLDILFGFNSIDHGWDYKSSIKECIRVSKECYISFDTNRYKSPQYPDLNHYQIVDYDEVASFVDSLKSDKIQIKHWFWEHSIPGGNVKIFEMGVIKK